MEIIFKRNNVTKRKRTWLRKLICNSKSPERVCGLIWKICNWVWKCRFWSKNSSLYESGSRLILFCNCAKSNAAMVKNNFKVLLSFRAGTLARGIKRKKSEKTARTEMRCVLPLKKICKNFFFFKADSQKYINICTISTTNDQYIACHSQNALCAWAWTCVTLLTDPRSIISLLGTSQWQRRHKHLILYICIIVVALLMWRSGGGARGAMRPGEAVAARHPRHEPMPYGLAQYLLCVCERVSQIIWIMIFLAKRK